MKKLMLPILAALALGLAASLVAQTPDPSQQPAPASPAVQAAPAEQPTVPDETRPADANVTTDQSRELPRTASPLATLALLGVGSGVSALAFRRLR